MTEAEVISFPKKKRAENRLLLDTIKKMRCCICGMHPGSTFNPIDPSHIKTRGAGGGDHIWNVVPHCRMHHREWEDSAKMDFLFKYPQMRALLVGLGWEISNGRLWHPEEGK